MRIKTTITLPHELLGRLDRIGKNRSALLERAALDYLARIENEKRDPERSGDHQPQCRPFEP